MLQYSSPTLEDYTHFCRGNQNVYFAKLTYFVEILFIFLNKNLEDFSLFVNILILYWNELDTHLEDSFGVVVILDWR